MANDLDKAVDYVMEHFDEVNRLYVKKIAAQILKIGQLGQANINRLIIMQEMTADIKEITTQLAVATNRSVRDVLRIYQSALDQTYTDARFRNVLEQKPLSTESKAKINRYVQQISVQTAQAMTNYSNTTAVSEIYRDAVDKAILAASSGLTDYNSAVRQVINDLGHSGLQVQYESGYHRRLDTAVRQNIVDGMKQIAQNASLMMGDEIGEEYDAVELSAHAMSAPDHEPIQGRVFLKDEFEKLQSGQPFSDVDGNHYEAIDRAIGEWNCKHLAMSFSTQYSVRRYTNDQLQKWAEANARGCTIDGRHYSMYQATQYMRQLETKIRREKDAAVAAQNAGDMTLRRECQEKINALSQRYGNVAAQAGLRTQRDRTSVEGFRAVKV